MRGCDFSPMRKQRCQLLRIQLAKSAKIPNPCKLANADQTERRSSEFAFGKPVEQIKQMNLAKEIVLEPEHYFFVVRESLQSSVLVPQLCGALLKIKTVCFREICCASI